MELYPAFNDFAVDDTVFTHPFDGIRLGNLFRIGWHGHHRPNRSTTARSDVRYDFIIFDGLIINDKVYIRVATEEMRNELFESFQPGCYSRRSVSVMVHLVG